MPARLKRVYFDYDKGVELLLKLACAYQGRAYIPCKNQDEIDRRLELFSDTEFCEKISEAACGVDEIRYELEEIQKYKRQGKEPPRFRARYPKDVWEFGRKLKYDNRDKIYLHTRTFWQFREYIEEPKFTAKASEVSFGERVPDFCVIQCYFLRSTFPIDPTQGRWFAYISMWENGDSSLVTFIKGKGVFSQIGALKETGLGEDLMAFVFQSADEIKQETTVVLHSTASNKTITGCLFVNGVSWAFEGYRKSDGAYPNGTKTPKPTRFILPPASY